MSPPSSPAQTGEYTVRIVESLKEVPREQWDALVGETDPPFLLWDFLQALEEAGCVSPEHGWLPVHLTVWRKTPHGEELCAAAPAYLKGNSNGEFVFDWAWADLAGKLRKRYYPKLIVAVPFTPVTGPRRLLHPGLPLEERESLLSLLAGAMRGMCEQMNLSSAHVLFPPEADAESLGAAGFARRLSVQFHWHNDGYRDFDDFLSHFSAKRRHMLRRERSEVRKAGLSVSTKHGPFSDQDVAAMYRFYVSTVDKFFHGHRYLNHRFFQLIAERLPQMLEFVVAQKGSGPDAPLVAGAINLARGGRLYGRYWGQDEEADHRFLHFEVCYYHSIEECIARGFTAFEPGAGGEHKMSRGFVPTLTHSAHHLRDRQMDALIRDFLLREEQAVRREVAAALLDSPLIRSGLAG